MNSKPILTLGDLSLQQLALESLVINQQINKIPSARMTLTAMTDTAGGFSSALQSELAASRPGEKLTIAHDNQTLFSGYIISQNIILKGKTSSVILEARHALQNLLPVRRSQIYRQQSDEQILRALFDTAGVELTLTQAAQLNTQQDQIIQFRCDDWSFIRHRLAANNCWLLPDAASPGCTIRTMGLSDEPAETIANKDNSGEDLYELEIKFDNRFTLSETVTGGWDVIQQAPGIEQRASKSPFGTDGLDVNALQTPLSRSWQQYYSYQPEPQLAQSHLNHQQIAGIRGRLLLQGTLRFRCGGTLQLSQFGAGLDGTTVVTGVQHMHDKDHGWQTELSLGMLPDDPAPLPPIDALHIAVVAPYEEDSQRLDRIPVTIPALNLSEEIVFARLGKPWASNASGFCFYPEPGDEVIIGFFEHDARYPIILGSMHNPENKAPFAPDAANNVKALVVSREGKIEKLEFNQEQQTATLSAGDNHLVLFNNGEINLSANKAINVTAEDISQKASHSLALTGDNGVEITGNTINMKQ